MDETVLKSESDGELETCQQVNLKVVKVEDNSVDIKPPPDAVPGIVSTPVCDISTPGNNRQPSPHVHRKTQNHTVKHYQENAKPTSDDITAKPCRPIGSLNKVPTCSGRLATVVRRGKGETYVWTDSEVELLLNITLDYKVSKTQEDVDWESCQSKYADILVMFLERYPTETSPEFPHHEEDITKSIVTTKLKAIRCKYRQAVDSGRKRCHGRVVLLYFELCEQIWGRSLATASIPSSIETTDVDAVSHHRSADSASPSSALDRSVVEMSDVSDQLQESGGSSFTPSVVKERRDLLHAKLNGHKQDRLKRKVSAETQLLYAAKEDIQVKKRILDMMETSERQAADTFMKLSRNLERLTSLIEDGFSLLRQVMHAQPQPVNMPPHRTMDPCGHTNASAPPVHEAAGTPPPGAASGTLPPDTTVTNNRHTPGST